MACPTRDDSIEPPCRELSSHAALAALLSPRCWWRIACAQGRAINLDLREDPLLLALRRPSDDHNYAAHEWSKNITAAEANNARVDAQANAEGGDNEEEWRLVRWCIDVVAERSPYAPQAPLSQLAQKARARAEVVLDTIGKAERRSPWEATQELDSESDDEAVAHAVGELARVSEELHRACSEELSYPVDEEDE